MILLMLMMAVDKLEPTIVWDLEKHDVFQHWTSFDVNDNDLLAIIDPTAKQLLLINAANELQGRYGQDGKGPGEFQSPTIVQWLSENRAFIVFDRVNRRGSLWNVKGELVKEYRVPVKLLETTEFLDQDSLFYVWKQYGQGGKKPTLLKYHIPTKKYVPVWEYELKDKTFTVVPMSHGDVTMIMPWDGRVCFDVADDFVAVTYPDSNAINIIDFNGKTLASFSPRLKSFPVLEEQVQSVIDERDQKIANIMNANRNKVAVPDAWPLVKEIRIDDKNRIWVTGSENRATGYHPLAVYDRSGKKLHETEIQSAPRRSHGDALYYIHIKDDTNINLEKVVVKLP